MCDLEVIKITVCNSSYCNKFMFVQNKSPLSANCFLILLHMLSESNNIFY